jgi:hypothetical protein
MGRGIIVFLCFILLAASLLGQSDTDKLKKKVSETVSIEQSTQQKQDDWAAEKAELTVRYRNAQANVQYLSERVAIKREESEALDERIAELERRIGEAKRIENNLEDTLNTVMARFERLIKSDLPFLMDERRTRLEVVNDVIARPDVSGADKLRRLLEALQIEANYGGTVEVHQDRIIVEGDTLYADILRLGRVSVFWRTPDGRRAGEYNLATRSWVELPKRHIGPIGDAMDMASRIRPVELIELPLGRIKP